MDFQTFQMHVNSRDKPFKVHKYKKSCENALYSCNIFSNETNTDMMSPLVYELLYFNQKILSLTQELWSDLLSIVFQAELLSRKNGCFSINNADGCIALNSFYQKFNTDLVSYQSLYLDSESVKEDHDQLQNVFNSLEIFLNKTLPIIEKDIKNLTIMIPICRDGGCSERSFFKENVGKIVNNVIKKYLSKFRQAVACFGQEEIPQEMTDRKEKIIFELDRIYNKKGGLLENLESECEVQPYVVDNINDNNVIKENTRPFKNDILFDNLAYENSIDLNSVADKTKEHILASNLNIETNENRKAISDISLSAHSEKRLNINEYIMHDVHKNKDAYRYDTSSSLRPEQLDKIEYASNENWIVFVSVVSVFGLIAFLLYFAINKHKKRKRNQPENVQIVYADEEERFKDYFLYN